MSNVNKLQALGLKLNKTSGQTKIICPKCSHTRKQQNRKDPCLSVNIDEGIFNCHNCGYNGGVDGKKAYVIPNYIYNEQTEVDKGQRYLIEERGLSKTTLAAWKVQTGKHYIPAEQKEVDCIQFPYYRNGACVNVKYRSLNKGFMMVSNAELIMYGVDTISENHPCIITEGEIDALSCFEAGFKSVLSVPNGASKGNNNLQYIDNTASYLEPVKKFILALDKDDAGEKLLQELSRRLGKDKCYIVDYPEGCKDANEVLVKYGYGKLKDCIDNAKPMPIEGVVTASQCYDGLLHIYKNGIDKGDMLGMYGFDDLVSFKTSMMYIITGIPTHGKSSFLNVVESMLAAKHKWKWAIYSPEHFPLEYLVYRYAEILVGKGFFHNSENRMGEGELKMAVDFVEEHFFFIRPTKGMFTMKQLLDTARSLVLRHGVRGFTIDPWNTIDHDYKTGMSETQLIEKSLNELTIFKQVHDVAVFLVAHPRKMNKIKELNHEMYGLHEVPTLYDISGSKSFYDKADVGMTVYRNMITGLTSVYVQKVKFKHVGDQGMQNFQYQKLNSRYISCDASGNIMDRNMLGHKPFVEVEIKQQEFGWGESSFEDEEDDLPF